MSLTILIAMSRSNWSVKVLVAAGLFVAGLILGPYSVFSPLPRILADTRSGPFFGTIFVVAGACIARFEPRMYTEKWALVAAAGLLLQIAEALLISTHSGRTLGGYDYLIGTVPFGIGMFMALKDIRYPSFMAWLGQCSLGMYCCHILVLNVLATFVIGSGGFASSVAGVAVIVTAVSLMSVGVSVGLYRIPAFRRFVR